MNPVRNPKFNKYSELSKIALYDMVLNYKLITETKVSYF